jgi:hypothetical protein
LHLLDVCLISIDVLTIEAYRVEEVSQFDGKIEDKSQFGENPIQDSQVAKTEIFVPRVLSAEDIDAPGDDTNDPALDIVVSWEGGGASGLTCLGPHAPGDGGDNEPFIDDEPAPCVLAVHHSLELMVNQLIPPNRSTL